MIKHTKGPWTQQFATFTPGYAATMRIFDADGNKAIADIFWGNGSNADANLIAAAPDLLSALEAVKRAMTESQGFVPFFMEDAINKAKGITNDTI